MNLQKLERNEIYRLLLCSKGSNASDDNINFKKLLTTNVALEVQASAS